MVLKSQAGLSLTIKRKSGRFAARGFLRCVLSGTKGRKPWGGVGWNAWYIMYYMSQSEFGKSETGMQFYSIGTSRSQQIAKVFFEESHTRKRRHPLPRESKTIKILI
jgi:hypothetical protein